MLATYNKPFATLQQQITLLEERGMTLPSHSVTAEHLQNIGYYRLSGYWYEHREFDADGNGKRLSTFRSGTCLVDVLRVYEFDRQLRLHLFKAIEMFEVALRFEIGHLIGRRGAFGHRDPSAIDPTALTTQASKYRTPGDSILQFNEHEHDRWLRGLDLRERHSQESFAAHFRTTYNGPLPIWVATEVMSFGQLVRLYDLLPQNERQRIAERFDVTDVRAFGDIATFSNWLNHLRYIRNSCAHHSRMWNRNLDVIIAVPAEASELQHLIPKDCTRRIYGTISILAHLLERTHPGNEWRQELQTVVATHAERSGADLRAMGFPESWRAEPVWQDGYVRDEKRAHRRELLSALDTVATTEALTRLSAVPTQERRSRLNYYRSKHVIISLRLTEAHAYPTFQFRDGDGHPIVLEANHRLYQTKPEELDEAGFPWFAYDWWRTALEVLDGTSPLDALRADALTTADLDRILRN